MEIFYLPHIDITTLDELLDELTYVGEVDTAVELISDATRKFRGRGAYLEHLWHCSYLCWEARQARRHATHSSLRYSRTSRRGLVLFSETLFLTALNVCAIAGDYDNALLIFGLYEERYGVVQHKAYLLLLASYVAHRMKMAMGMSEV